MSNLDTLSGRREFVTDSVNVDSRPRTFVLLDDDRHYFDVGA